MRLIDVQALNRGWNSRQSLLIDDLCAFVHSQPRFHIQSERNFGRNKFVVIVVPQIAHTHARRNSFQARCAVRERVKPTCL